MSEDTVVQRTPEQQAAYENRVRALAKARETKKQNALTAPPKVVDVVKEHLSDERVWLDGLLTAMKNLEVRSEIQVKNCVKIADEVLAVFKEKFK